MTTAWSCQRRPWCGGATPRRGRSVQQAATTRNKASAGSSRTRNDASTRAQDVQTSARRRNKTSGSNRSRNDASATPPQAQQARVSLQQQLAFERHGFCVLRGLLPAAEVEAMRAEVKGVASQGRLQALRQRVRVLCPGADAEAIPSAAAATQLLRERATDQVGFLQFFNSWRSRQCIRHLVLGGALAAAAAQLLGASRVRLYQDCVFLKEPGFAVTNWHSDLRMAPLDTNSFVTAWVPLRPVKGSERDGDSGLLFAAGSHRDFALPFWYDLSHMALDGRGYKLQGTGAMELGDVSFHHGWTLHCAGPQPPDSPPRLALAACYFADGARLLPEPGGRSAASRALRPGHLHDEDAESYRDWIGDVKGGSLAVHALLPLAWPAEAATMAAS